MKKTVLLCMLAVFTSVMLLGTGCKQQNNDENSETPEVKYGDEPYDKVIGNGHYVLHNFIGENTVFDKETIYDASDYYLGKAEKWTDDYINDFEQSLADRPAAKKYFSNFINDVRNRQNHFKYDKTHIGGGSDFDWAVNQIVRACEPYFTDFIGQLDNLDQCADFEGSYRILALQAKNNALGSARSQARNTQIYNEERKKIDDLVDPNRIDINQEYGANNFTGITDLLDEQIVFVVDKMNTNENPDVTCEDWQKFFNFAMNTEGFFATDKRMGPSVGHTGYCEMIGGTINSTIDRAITAKCNEIRAQKDQGKTY